MAGKSTSMRGIREPGPDPRSKAIDSVSSSDALVTSKDLSDDQNLCGFMETAHEDGKRRKSVLEKDWHLNAQFLQGNHYLVWDRNEASWKPDKRRKHLARYRGNIVSTYVQTRGAKMQRTKPKFYVRSVSNEPEDRECATASNRILRHLWDKLKVHGDKIPSFVTDLLVFGTAIMKAKYDPAKGMKMAFGAVELEDIYRDAEEKPDDLEVYAIGEADLEVVSPFCVFPDPNADNWTDIAWLLDARVVGLDKIRNDFPEHGYEVSETDQDARNQPEHYRALIRGYPGLQNYAHQSEQRLTPTAMVRELWLKPTRQYPKGLHAITAGNVVLHKGPLPEWTGGEIPYYFMVDRLIPRKLWGSAVCDDVRDITKSRNQSMSQKLNNASLIGNPPIRKPHGTKMRSEEFIGMPGAIWTYSPTAGGHKPEYVAAPPLPNYVQSLPDELLSDIHIISGLNEPTMRASAPSNVRTASGLAALIKQDDSRQVQVMNMFSGVLSKVGRCLLRIVATQYKEERLGKIVGEKGDITSFMFCGDDIVGDKADTPGADYYDVEITVDSGHRSKEADQQFILLAVQTGLINVNDEEQRRKVYRMLDIGDPEDSIFGELSIDEEQARQENMWMAHLDDNTYRTKVLEGLMRTHDWDSHPLHVKVHTEYMRRREFLELPIEIRNRFLSHREEHTIEIEEAQMREQQLQMAQQGQMGGGGPSAQPPPGAPGSAAGPPPQSMSMAGMAQEPAEAQPPNLEGTMFAGA